MPIDNPGDAPDFITPAMQRLAAGCDLPAFSDWFAAEYAAYFLEGARMRQKEDPADEARRAARALAREIWRITPDPAHGWRPRPAPRKPGRNDPCVCGSGRKFKLCCESLMQELPPLEMAPASMAGLLFPLGPPAWRQPQALLGMLPAMLASCTSGWYEVQGALAVVDLLEPVFAAPKRLGDAYSDVFDQLQDAMQEAGLEARREQLARRVADQGAGKQLRCTALSRLAVMICDRGDSAQAWDAFRSAQRLDPGDPQLLQAEMLMLLAEGRAEEARQRAPLLAARARRLGYDELAGILLELGDKGLDALERLDPGGVDAEEERGWIALLREAASSLKAETFEALHEVECVANAEGTELIVRPAKATLRETKSWSASFAAQQPMLVGLSGDASEILDDPAQAQRWLATHAQSAAALPVLDDLLLAARQMVLEGGSSELLAAACELAFAAADMLVAALRRWPEAEVPWGVHDNRPLLRVVSQAIDFALQTGKRERGLDWMRWMLARNPNDNHGWREVQRRELLAMGDAAGAIALLDAYPDDMPPAQHDRALALFMLGRTAEAGRLLRRAHAEFPAFVGALLPDTLDRPPGEMTGTVAVGGAEHAWEWRAEVRAQWARCGALDWLRGLGLPAAQQKEKAWAAPKPQRSKSRSKAAAREPTPAEDAGRIALLERHFGERLPWLMGWLAGVAWCPGTVMPTAWVHEPLQQLDGLADEAALNEILSALMEQYNAMNHQRLEAAALAAVPLPETIAPQDDAAWLAFAGGFVQVAEVHARGGWRSAGVTVSTRNPLFAPLYQLAARAQPGPGGWRAQGDEAQPLLAVAGDTEPVRALLSHALQPLWQTALAARS